MNNPKDQFSFFAADLNISQNLIRSYLDKEALEDSRLYFSISHFGVITPVTVIEENSSLLVVTGAKRTYIASLLQQKVPVHYISPLSKHLFFQTILADNLEQHFSFMDWAVLLKNLSYHNLEKTFTPLLKILQKKWKYPLHFELVTTVFKLPACCIRAIANEQWSWQIIYYHHYFSLKEWEMIYRFFRQNGIKRNMHRSFLENFIIFRQRQGTKELQNLLQSKGSARHFRRYFNETFTPQYASYKETVQNIQSDIHRTFPGKVQLHDDPEKMSLDIQLHLKSQSEVEHLPGLIKPLKKYWTLNDD